jgi:hypothetical protein
MKECLSATPEPKLIKKTSTFSDKHNVTYEIAERNVFTENVSANVPMHRFLGGLCPLFNLFSDCKIKVDLTKMIRK